MQEALEAHEIDALDQEYGLLRTNTLPTKLQTMQFSKRIDAGSADINELTAQIEQAQAAVNDLIRRRDKRQAEVDLHRAVVAPVRILPTEVLSYIFELCMEEPPVKPDASKAPLLLCGICSRWREVALGTPTLWHNLHISVAALLRDTPEDADRFYSSRVKIAETWLGRARTMPLNLTMAVTIKERRFFTRPRYRDFPPFPVAAFFRPHARTLRSLTMELPKSQYSSLCAIAPIPMPSLESLVISKHSLVSAGTDESERIVVFSETPQLRRLELRSMGRFTQSQLVLDWTELTDVRLNNTYMPRAACVGLLRACPQLEYCELGTCLFFQDTTPEGGPTVLSKLHTLKIVNDDDDFSALFQFITTPALRELDLRSWPTYDPGDIEFIWEQREFEEFCARSELALTSLAIGFPLRGDDLLAVLRAQPSLETLELRTGLHLDGFLVGAFIWDHAESQRQLLPRLQRLHLYELDQQTAHVFGQQIVDVVESRFQRRWFAPSTTLLALRLLTPTVVQQMHEAEAGNPELGALLESVRRGNATAEQRQALALMFADLVQASSPELLEQAFAEAPVALQEAPPLPAQLKGLTLATSARSLTFDDAFAAKMAQFREMGLEVVLDVTRDPRRYDVTVL